MKRTSIDLSHNRINKLLMLQKKNSTPTSIPSPPPLYKKKKNSKLNLKKSTTNPNKADPFIRTEVLSIKSELNVRLNKSGKTFFEKMKNKKDIQKWSTYKPQRKSSFMNKPTQLSKKVVSSSIWLNHSKSSGVDKANQRLMKEEEESCISSQSNSKEHKNEDLLSVSRSPKNSKIEKTFISSNSNFLDDNNQISLKKANSFNLSNNVANSPPHPQDFLFKFKPDKQDLLQLLRIKNFMSSKARNGERRISRSVCEIVD